MNVKFVVVKETPGYHIDSYSDTEDLGEFEEFNRAWAFRNNLPDEEHCTYYIAARLAQE